MWNLRLSRIAGAGVLAALPALAAAQSALPLPPAPFAGKIDPDPAKSTPDWPKPIRAPRAAPNVLLILLDDVGYGATSMMGGPIATPALERLAREGLRYNNFHVNSLCSPTRGALLSGRNDHQLGFGQVTEGATGYPGYNSVWPRSAASVAAVLQANGYSTAAFGKWHNTPTWEVGPRGPFTRWPTALGFDYYYGFMAAADSQYETRLYRNTTPVEPEKTPDQGYHLTTDLTNDAIHWLHQHDAVAGDQPFFIYFATGATHEPHQVPQSWVEKYKGRFDEGWDAMRQETFARQKAAHVIPANAELTPRPAELPAWESLAPPDKQLLEHQAEVYGGFLAQTDYEVGRLIDAIRQEGKADNTLILYIVGDNGASGEGGLEGHDKADPAGRPVSVTERLKIAHDLGNDLYFNHYAAGWAWGLDAPFQWTKQVASHLGGTTDPLVVSWPARITDHGAVRPQFQHVTDIAPTIYEAAGITPPDTVNGVKQMPFEGHSLLASLTNAAAPSTHPVQYFEMLGNRGIYKDGWWAGSRHLLPWESFTEKYETVPVGNHPWELYNLTEDFSQAHDLAAKNPDKLRELVALFDSEARRNQVYPLTPRYTLPPSVAAGRTHFDYYQDVARVTQQQFPILRGRNFVLHAYLTVPANGADGVIAADGGSQGGFTLYVKDGHPVFEVNANHNTVGRVAAADPLPAGPAEIEVSVTANNGGASPEHNMLRSMRNKAIPGHFEVKVNGRSAGGADIANFVAIYGETFDVGRDLGSPVSDAYRSPNPYTGTISKVTLDVSPDVRG